VGIRLKIGRVVTGDARTSLRVLAKTTAAVQNLAEDLGRALAAMDPAFEARSEAEIERECQLVAEVKPGSVDMVIEISPPPTELWREYSRPSLGERVLRQVGEFMDAISVGNAAGLQEVIPEADRRRRVTRRFTTALLDRSDDHIVQWSRVDGEPLRPIYRPDPEIVERLIGSGTTPLEAEADKVVVKGRCVVILGKDGSPGEVSEWLEYEVMSREGTEPYVTDQVAWRDRLFVLEHQIECPATIEDHLLVIRYEPLGIRAYAPTRGAALRDFAEEFAFRYDDYALARDEELTRSAIDLKRRLRELVKEVRSAITPSIGSSPTAGGLRS